MNPSLIPVGVLVVPDARSTTLNDRKWSSSTRSLGNPWSDSSFEQFPLRGKSWIEPILHQSSFGARIDAVAAQAGRRSYSSTVLLVLLSFARLECVWSDDV